MNNIDIADAIEMIEEIDRIDLRLEELRKERSVLANKIIEDNPDDFDIWLKYADKKHYTSCIDEGKLGGFLISFELNRCETIHLDRIVNCLDEYADYSAIGDEETANAIKKELMELNFGSCEWDW